MKLWIVGAQGMLGKVLTTTCNQLGIEYVGSGRSEADLTNSAQLSLQCEAIQPTHIVNCAAYTDVDRAEVQREEAFLVNVIGAENVAQVAKRAGARLIHISSDYVFSGEKGEEYTEEDPCDPVNFYGWTKWQGERRVQEALHTACIVRTSWLFGRGGKNFISNLLEWLPAKEKIQVVADQFSCPTYCVDLARALLAIADKQGIFHFCNRGKGSRYEIALAVSSLLEKSGEVVPVKSAQFPTLASRPLCTALGTRRWSEATGLAPRGWDAIFKEFILNAHGSSV